MLSFRLAPLELESGDPWSQTGQVAQTLEGRMNEPSAVGIRLAQEKASKRLDSRFVSMKRCSVDSVGSGTSHFRAFSLPAGRPTDISVLRQPVTAQMDSESGEEKFGSLASGRSIRRLNSGRAVLSNSDNGRRNAARRVRRKGLLSCRSCGNTGTRARSNPSRGSIVSKVQSDGIAASVGGLGETVSEHQQSRSRGVDVNGDGWTSSFDLVEGSAAVDCALSYRNS